MICSNGNTRTTNKTNWHVKVRIDHYLFERNNVIKSIVLDVISHIIVFDRNLTCATLIEGYQSHFLFSCLQNAVTPSPRILAAIGLINRAELGGKFSWSII